MVRIFVVVVGVCVLYAFYNHKNGLIRYWELSRIRDREQRELIQLEQEKSRLRESIYRLETDTLYVEGLARELGMVKKGETGYRIVDEVPDRE